MNTPVMHVSVLKDTLVNAANPDITQFTDMLLTQIVNRAHTAVNKDVAYFVVGVLSTHNFMGARDWFFIKDEKEDGSTEWRFMSDTVTRSQVGLFVMGIESYELSLNSTSEELKAQGVIHALEELVYRAAYFHTTFKYDLARSLSVKHKGIFAATRHRDDVDGYLHFEGEGEGYY